MTHRAPLAARADRRRDRGGPRIHDADVDEAEPRRDFIETNALRAGNIDV